LDSVQNGENDQQEIVGKVGYCTACYTGNYPTQWVDVEEILPAAAAL
jgi:hypothetical protein